jgi:hypothetical protein
MMVTRKIGSQNDTFSNLDWYTLFFMSKMDFIHTIDQYSLSIGVYHNNPKRGTDE